VTDFLNLPNVQTTAVEELSDSYIVEAQAIGPVAATCRLSCPVKKNGTKVREINDTPIHGKGVLIRYRSQRFMCSECGNAGLYERLPFVQDGFWMTGRLLVHMGKQSMRRTFAEVARECHVDRKTASNAFNAYVGTQIARLNRKTPRVLGIDEKMLLGAYRAVLGNIEARTVLDMLPDREGSLERYLIDLPNRQDVEVICTDRYDAYRLMIAKQMPGRLHVTDRFHIVAKASETLDRIRASVAKSLPDRRRGANLRMARPAGDFSPAIREGIEHAIGIIRRAVMGEGLPPAPSRSET
jgi:transposase